MNPPQFNVPLTDGNNMTVETYQLLSGMYEALTAAQAALAQAQTDIVDLEARVTVLEP